MLILNLYGGIGNQLFQYAFGQLYALSVGKDLYLNRAGFQIRNDHHGVFLFDEIEFDGYEVKYIDNIVVGYALKIGMKVYNALMKQETETKESILYNMKYGFCCCESSVAIISDIAEIVSKKESMLIDGYFQWPKVLKEIIDIMKKSIVYKQELRGEALEYFQKICGGNSVCIHIRRGDYLNLPFMQVCGMDYYQRAIEYILENVDKPVFFVFSDDIEWAKASLGKFNNMEFVEGNHAVSNELRLMSQCKYFIISNSTFGWWGQKLSNQNNKIVVCPDIWYMNGAESELIEEEYHRIKVLG